jgi:hypothetical protein
MKVEVTKRVALVSTGTGVLISGLVLWLSWNYSHNAAIGVPVNILSLLFLPGTMLYVLVSAQRDLSVSWTWLSLMLASGARFYGFVVFIAWSAMGAMGRLLSRPRGSTPW